MREWVELFDEPRLVHRELEVHILCTSSFCTSWPRPTAKDISGYFACLYQVCS